MERDKRYGTVKKLLESGHISGIPDIADTVPPSVIARDLGIHFNRFKKLLDNPTEWIMKDLYAMAKLIGVPGRRITDLVNDQIEKGKKK